MPIRERLLQWELKHVKLKFYDTIELIRNYYDYARARAQHEVGTKNFYCISYGRALWNADYFGLLLDN